MAVYRFRISFEDYDEVTREIDMLAKHTFLDFHQAIHKSTGYDPKQSSSFYVSNDQWKKGLEIAHLPNDKKRERGVIQMEKAKLNRHIDDPHQKFYYTYNFNYPYDFHIELIKILKEESGKTYPFIHSSIGLAPKLPGAAILPNSDTDDKKTDGDAAEEDILADTEYGIDTESDLNMLSNDGDNDDGFNGGLNDDEEGF